MAFHPGPLEINKTRPADLPDFKRPPLVEVVLGVQFSELTRYRTVHAGLLWGSKFRNSFPKFVEQPPLDTVFEVFGAVKPAQTQVQITTASGPMVPRLWFKNKEDTELIQIQSDRFLHNWRKTNDDVSYPRYESIRDRFFEELHEVRSFFEEEKIGSIEPNQCEVTYVNHINLGDKSDVRAHFYRIFNFLKPFDEESGWHGENLPELEDGVFNVRFIIRGPNAPNPLGRLYIEIQSAVDSAGIPIVRASLTARGAPLSPEFKDVAKFFDVGRDAIVRGFTAVTTPEMHKLWERVQ